MSGPPVVIWYLPLVVERPFAVVERPSIVVELSIKKPGNPRNPRGPRGSNNPRNPRNPINGEFRKFIFVEIILFLKKKLRNLAKAASMYTQLKVEGRRVCVEARGRRANLGFGHILPPLRDGVYGERWGWAAADVTAGPT